MRTNNDTWDITTSVGSTALYVAAARAVEAQKPWPLAVDAYADVFCRAVGGDWSDLLDGNVPEHPLMTAFGKYFVDFQGARTRYFDTYFRNAAMDGVRQIVLLAAGLDSRAYRLPWPDGTTVFELDQPQVLEFKRETLGDTRPSAQRREIPVDLRNDWPQALRDSGFEPGRPSAWIVEGLLLYLPATAQERLFTGIDSLGSPGSHLAIEESAPLDADTFAAKLAEELDTGGVNGRGRPFYQLVYNQQFAPAAQWFGDRGWRAEAVRLADYLRSVGRPAPVPDSEAGAMTGNISLVSAVKA
ncbi:MAG: hypothetical protein QOD39_2958 [Mycobacterium sp.]|nr:hypothetical protein [Mycobacterium sp.]